MKRRVDSRCAADGKDNTVIDQIMLRFRPIAPKPATAESSGYVLPENDRKRKRAKRKYARVNKKKKIDKARECNLPIKDTKNWFDLEKTVTDPVRKVSNWISFDLSGNKRKGTENNFNLFISEPPEKFPSGLHGVDLATAVDERKVVESWITMESVTGTCEDRRLIGYTDDEIRKHLESDSCPGFISNGYDEVLWVNPEYRRLLDLNPDGGEPASEVVVWLTVKVEKSTVVKYLPAFSCKVRIEYRSSEKKIRMTVPCDVFKMDSGGFAWLLDVRYALSLGPLN
ncbi:hypothetical protein L1987_36517 [Smallanthus sonchifolius]|uniref:Uncharacterized protein n=1 Tax=Smallanthus sonchifolius TaxID=185202 RepID=A0ACB9HDT6_9ASTR|nr:hypothetical protein L1987_36517 [Smallanthus sonchifolius]